MRLLRQYVAGLVLVPLMVGLVVLLIPLFILETITDNDSILEVVMERFKKLATWLGGFEKDGK